MVTGLLCKDYYFEKIINIKAFLGNYQSDGKVVKQAKDSKQEGGVVF